VFSVVGGFVGIPAVLLKDSNWLATYLSPVIAAHENEHPYIHLSHGMELALMVILVVVIAGVIYAAMKRYAQATVVVESNVKGMSKFLANKWYVDEMYNSIIVKPINFTSSFLSRIVDNKLIDGLVNGIGRALQYSSRQLRLLQSGQVGSYVLIMVISIIIFFIFQLFWKF